MKKNDKERLIKITEVIHMTGLSRSTIYWAIKEGQFPTPTKISPRRVGWVESEIQGWITSKIKEKL